MRFLRPTNEIAIPSSARRYDFNPASQKTLSITAFCANRPPSNDTHLSGDGGQIHLCRLTAFPGNRSTASTPGPGQGTIRLQRGSEGRLASGCHPYRRAISQFQSQLTQCSLALRKYRPSAVPISRAAITGGRTPSLAATFGTTIGPIAASLACRRPIAMSTASCFPVALR